MGKLSKEQIEFLYSPISKQEQKAQKDRFIAKFSPVLTQNGFIKKGAGFFRIYGDNIFQWVELWHQPFYPRMLYIECNAEPLYVDYVHALEHGFGPGIVGWPYNIQNSDGHERNIGCSLESFLGYVDARSGEITPFQATRNFDEALEEEFLLFVEQGLPRLNQIVDVQSYLQTIPFACYHYWYDCENKDLSISWLTVVNALEHGRYRDAVPCLEQMIAIVKRRLLEHKQEMSLSDPNLLERIEILLSTDTFISDKDLNLCEDRSLIQGFQRIIHLRHLITLLELGDEQAIETYKAQYHQMAYDDLNRLSPRILKNPVKPKL